MGKLNDRLSEITTVNTDELVEFIKESLENRDGINKRVMIGTINEDAQARIEAKCGKKVKDIDIDQSIIIHAITQLHHNLEPEDLLLAVDAINTATDIELSDEKHQNCDVLVFQKDIDGDITFLTAVRAKNGYLLVFDVWRQKKARSRRRPDAAKKLPRAYAQNDPPRNELSTISHKPDEKSSGGDEKWFRNVLTGSQLKQFIDDVRNGKNPGNALIGMVSDSTKKKVKELTGIDVTKIILEGTSITHVDDQKHKLEADDIEKCVEVINNPIDTTLSPKKTAQGLDVVCFKGNTNGIIYFLEVVHKNYDGWLSLKTAYRLKKASVVPQWSKDPGANVQNAPPPASTLLLPHFDEKSSEGYE